MHTRISPRFVLLPVAVLAASLALLVFVVARHSGTTQALMPLPIQPFGPTKSGGMSTTVLGQPFTDYGVTEVSRGQRRALSWEYSAPGFSVPSDADIEDGTVEGSVIMRQDVLCDSTTFPGNEDVWAQATPAPPEPLAPYGWREATTAVEGGPDQFLKSTMPPFPFLLRHKADVDHLWLGGSSLISENWPLNTIYSKIPWSPNQGALIATTRQGGGAAPSPYTAVCIDSPEITTQPLRHTRTRL